MNWHFEQRADLLRPSGVLSYPDLMMAQGDNLAHTWRVQVYSGGQPMDLTGYAVTGYFDRSDGKTVAVIGEAVGHAAAVVMPQSVYASAGPLTGLLRAVKDGQVITLAAGRWNVRRGPGDEIVDPEHVVPSLKELLDKIDEIEAAASAAHAATQAANTAVEQVNEAVSGIDAKVTSAIAPVADDVDALKADVSRLIGKHLDGTLEQIADIVRGHSTEENALIFPVGDQIVMPWKDMDDPNHNTDETAYQVGWDIVHHGDVELQDGSIVPGMFIQMHLCSAYGVQFSHQQAFMCCRDGLAAGTYHVTFGATFGSNGADADTSWQFTLTQAVPAGGRLSGFDKLLYQVPANWRVKSWATPTSTDPIETVPVTAGNGGTSLGTMLLASVGDDGLNSMQAVAFGHNRWSTSAVRQYLNSTGSNWFSSQEDFDIRPDQYNKKGFMSGFSSDFLAAVKPVKVTTALNTVEGFADAAEDTFDTFFLPSLEQINVTPQFPGVEGDYFEYWRRRMGLNGFINYAWEAEPNKSTALLIPAINVNSAQYVRLRSANRNNAYETCHVSTLGTVRNDGSTIDATRFFPVCVIC